MEELIILVLSFIGELLIESLIYFPWDLFIGSYERKNEGKLNTFGWCVVSLFLGIGMGYASTLIFPNIIFDYTWLRIINLLVAPLLAGALAVKMSKRREQKDLTTNNKLHYLVGFLFTLGLVGARYVLAQK
jgi:hypothetical protein